MKKIDKLVLTSFIGPFILTFLVVVFILLMQHMLRYFDDIIGKGLDVDVIGQLLFYFAIFMTPVAMPLAVLLSALITFGNLGEHFELTAIKSAGISLVRTLQPIFFFVLMLTVVAFYINNNVVPKAALEAYSLLYDIKQKKPALELREGTFYNGIPDISIKVNERFSDEKSLRGVIIYDHRKNDGNKEVTVADSGRMYTILNEQYLKLELFNGYNYIEGSAAQQEMIGSRTVNPRQETLSRSKFSKTQVVFDLSSFKLERTDKKWFQGNRIMRNLSELDEDIDSLENEILTQRLAYYLSRPSYFTYHLRKDTVIMPPEVHRFKLKRDSLAKVAHIKNTELSDNKIKANERVISEPIGKVHQLTTPLQSKKATLPGKLKSKTSPPPLLNDSLISYKLDSVFMQVPQRDLIQSATNMARQVKSQLLNSNTGRENFEKELIIFQLQWHKIIANSMACIAMFLIGAPLGAIIKRGGLGVPFLVSIFFFIIFYVLSMQGDKLAKQETISVTLGVWAADIILFIIGLFFLRQARIDARLFEADFYAVLSDKVKSWLARKRLIQSKTA